jgi:hypothetical protein
MQRPGPTVEASPGPRLAGSWQQGRVVVSLYDVAVQSERVHPHPPSASLRTSTPQPTPNTRHARSISGSIAAVRARVIVSGAEGAPLLHPARDACGTKPRQPGVSRKNVSRKNETRAMQQLQPSPQSFNPSPPRACASGGLRPRHRLRCAAFPQQYALVYPASAPAIPTSWQRAVAPPTTSLPHALVRARHSAEPATHARTPRPCTRHPP